MSANEHLQIKRHLKQDNMIKSSLANGDGPWTVVCDDWNDGHGNHGGRYITLSKPELREQILDRLEWDLTKGRGVPGFTGSIESAQYFRNDSAPEFEPLVIIQEFHEVVPDAILISEEFRLLMNLWRDPSSGKYFQIGADGSKTDAIRIDERKVEVRTSILKHYLAARQLDAVLFVDSVASVPAMESAEAFENLEIAYRRVNNYACLARNIGEIGYGNRKIFSRVLAKRLLFAPPQNTCGIWPWDDLTPADYPEFIIGENDAGEPIKFTCNPDRLANYFGANPEAPHYLTPVFFDAAVLQKYYDNPSLYNVTDGHLSCARKWSVRIDNEDPTSIVVFLGDIGRDIPQSEWPHWKYYNVSPLQSMSMVGYSRAFLNQNVASLNPEHRFKASYSALNREWKRRWGWPFFREAVGQDASIIHRLRIPVNGTDAELRIQLLNLALVLVDLLNEKEFTAKLPEHKNEKGIAKLQRFLDANSYTFVDRDISLLRQIQTLRSRIAAHASGSSGQQFLDNALSGRSPQEYVQYLMAEATQMLDDLIEFTKQPTS